MTLEKQIESVEGSIREVRDSLFQRLENIRSGQSSLFAYVAIVAVFHGCVGDAKYKGLKERLDNIAATQEQCTEMHREADAKWYLINGKKAYIMIEGKPTEQYIKEKTK